MIIGVHGKSFKKRGGTVVDEVFRMLESHKVTIRVSEKFDEILRLSHLNRKYEIYAQDDDGIKLDFLFSLGGDGTLLEALTHVNKAETPILGINTGRLGYLATISRNNVKEAIQAIFDNSFELDERILIHLDDPGDLFNGLNFALNDFTIVKKDTSSMILVHAYVDAEFMNSYWADGLITATPTGSTGYSLSCGGPLVMPHSDNFILTPVAPHNLSARPMVLSATSRITFEISGRAENVMISLDSRSRIIPSGTKLSIRKEGFKAKLVKLKGYRNFDTLRQKLNWGLDVRN